MGAGNTGFISRVKRDIIFNPRNKSGISAHPCTILHLIHEQECTAERFISDKHELRAF